MRHRWVLILTGLAVGVYAIGCVPAVPSTSPPSEPVKEATIKVRPTESRPASPVSQRLVRQAKQDLAKRLAVSVDEIELVEAEAVVWPDSSMGCPRPGMAYTQVQHDGLLIRLRAGKRTYEYHSGSGRPPFLCEEARK